jgi:NAD kinase
MAIIIIEDDGFMLELLHRVQMCEISAVGNFGGC